MRNNSTQNKIKKESIEALISEVILPQSKLVLNADKTDDKIYIALANIVERAFRSYLDTETNKSDVQEMNLEALVIEMNKLKVLPFSLVSYAHKVRIGGNKRHKLLISSEDNEELLILKIELYRFIKWLYLEYFKAQLPRFFIDWHKAHIEPFLYSNNNMGTSPIEEKYIVIIEHQKKQIEDLEKQEKKLTQELINLKTK